MTYRRLGIAAALLLFASYLKVFLPAYTALLAPALHGAVDAGQLAVRLPAAWLTWLGVG